VAETDGTHDLVIGTRNGMAIPVLGGRRAADGPQRLWRARDFQLRDGDEVVADAGRG